MSPTRYQPRSVSATELCDVPSTSAVSKREHTGPCVGSLAARGKPRTSRPTIPMAALNGVQGHTRSGAGGGARTRDFRVGNAPLYQLRYACMVRFARPASAGCVSR